MKNLKKLLALMLVLAMSVCVFAACGDEPAPAKDDDEKVEDIAKNEEKDTDEKEDTEEKDDETQTEENAEEEVSYTDDELEQMLVGEWYKVGEIESYGVRHEYSEFLNADYTNIFREDCSYTVKSLDSDNVIHGRFMVESGVLYMSKSDFLFDVKWDGDKLILVSDYSNTGHVYEKIAEVDGQ